MPKAGSQRLEHCNGWCARIISHVCHESHAWRRDESQTLLVSSDQNGVRLCIVTANNVFSIGALQTSWWSRIRSMTKRKSRMLGPPKT
jgi:hypothetical protein